MSSLASNISEDAENPEAKPSGFRTTYHLRCSLDRCWDFWTREEHLRSWLATGALVDCSPGGIYDLHSPLPFQSGRHRVDEVREKSFLSFTWLLGNHPSRVTVAFEPDDEGVALSIEQSASPTPPPGVYYGYDPSGMSLQSQCWDYALSQLRCRLEEGGNGVELADQDQGDEVNLSIKIAASQHAIFSALTDFPELRKWEAMCMESGYIENRSGGRYSFGWESEHEGGDGPRSITEYIEGSKLDYSWFGNSPSTVSWNLAKTAGGNTRLVFRHSPFDLNRHAVWEYTLGWSSSLFALKWYLERNERPGAWIQRT